MEMAVLGLQFPHPEGLTAAGGDAMVVGMSTGKRARKTEKAPETGVEGTEREGSGMPRYFFYFRGKRDSLKAAGNRSKNDGVLEFWFGVGIVVALVAVVLLVCLHALHAVR